jgi:hypothetical protein
MTSVGRIYLILILLSVATAAMAGELRVSVAGVVQDPLGKPALDGTYPVTVRLWNGRGIYDSVLWVDSTAIHQLKGQFRLSLGPYPPLTRKTFSGDQSLSFQFPDEPEVRKRAVLESFNSAGRVVCPEVRFATGNIPSTSAGTRVRLHQGQTTSSVGVLLSISPERVELLQSYTRSESEVTRIPMDSITRFDISTRHTHHGDIGFLAGILFGGIGGYAMGAGEVNDLSMSKETKRGIDSIVGGVLGGLTGYLLGNSMSSDRWQQLPLERVKERSRTGSGEIVRSK